MLLIIDNHNFSARAHPKIVPVMENPILDDDDYIDNETDWISLSLDDRIVSAIKKLQWNKPTLVQANVIPLAFAGKDILVKAKTGSGKTGAYLIPIVQRILIQKEV
jgi:ATP-dependent RNA helicase DDX56/DBP9